MDRLVDKSVGKLWALGACASFTVLLLLGTGITTGIISITIEEVGCEKCNSPPIMQIISIIASQVGILSLGYSYAYWVGGLPSRVSSHTDGFDYSTIIGFSLTAISAVVLSALITSNMASRSRLWSGSTKTPQYIYIVQLKLLSLQ